MSERSWQTLEPGADLNWDLDQAKKKKKKKKKKEEEKETDLIPNQLLKQGMPRNREHKAWEEHPQRYHDCSNKGLSQAPINQPTLKADECSKYYQRCWQYVPDCDVVNKNTLGKPAALEDSLGLDNGYSRVRASEG
jgi:hypothetical protein